MIEAGLMRRCVSGVAMRRISCVDQPMMAGSASVWSPAVFLETAGGSHNDGSSLLHRERQH
jgi:hypothetical protein